MAKDKSVTLS